MTFCEGEIVDVNARQFILRSIVPYRVVFENVVSGTVSADSIVK